MIIFGIFWLKSEDFNCNLTSAPGRLKDSLCYKYTASRSFDFQSLFMTYTLK